MGWRDWLDVHKLKYMRVRSRTGADVGSVMVTGKKYDPAKSVGLGVGGVMFMGYLYPSGLIYGLISGLLYKSASGLAWGPHYAYYFAFYLLIDTS